jgi:uncharacterized membrane protein YczE
VLDAHTQKRLVAFLLGLSIAAFGVGLIVKSELGVSPVMSVPYVVSLYLPFTFGTCVAAEQIILLALQKVILKSDFKLKALWQFPTAVFFGVLCDAALFCYSSFSLTAYYERILALCLGICILAIGLCFQFTANVSVTAPDGFMLANSTYAKVKVSADWLFVALSVGLSFYFFSELQGVREGTLISALGVGTAVGLVKPTVQTFLRERLLTSTSSMRNE